VVGVTVADPLGPNVPTPAIATELAFVVVQLSTAEFPLLTVVGCALKVMVGAGGLPAVTVTTAEAVAVPPGPVAVAV